MIAYLEKYDTTVEVPDEIGQNDLADINTNFHHYVDQSPSAAPSTAPPQPQQAQAPAQAAPAPEPPSQWQPNFYESAIKPSLDQILGPAKAVATFPERPEAQAFGAGVIQEGTFGLAKPLTDALMGQQEQDHPAFAAAGKLTGGLGSLLVAGGAARALGAGALAARAGTASVEAGFAAGERFIPRAIMSGATFGTRAFIAQTVKAFEDGGVNLQQFGKDVLKDTAFGGIFGSIGGFENVAASVSSAGALGFISSKMDGADNREASLNAAIWGAFEAVGSMGRKEELRMEALRNLKASIGEYVGERNPGINDKDASRVASHFVDNAIRKAGFDSAEDIAKSGPENLLEGLEKVNQAVRGARIPAGAAPETPALPKLPAPVEPEASAAPAPAAAPQNPLEKAVDAVKKLIGFPTAQPTGQPASAPLPQGKRSYDQIMDSLKEQGHDITKIPPDQIPDDLKDVYHFEQGKAQKVDMEKGLGQIAERFQALGIKPNEGAAIFDAYGLDKKGSLGQPTPMRTDLPVLVNASGGAQDSYAEPIRLEFHGKTDIEDVKTLLEEKFPNQKFVITPKRSRFLDAVTKTQVSIFEAQFLEPKNGLAHALAPVGWKSTLGMESVPGRTDKAALTPTQLINAPIDDQYRQTYQALAAQRGIDKGQKFDARTMDHAQKAVDLINDHFNPQSQMLFDFAKAHGDLSDHQIAQMAYDRGMIEEPNNDLLKAEIQKAKQEKIVTPKVNAMLAPGAAMAPKTPEATIPAVTAHLKESKSEIENIINPTKAAPLAAQITREQLGKMARSYDMAEAALSNARELFDKQGKDKNLEFYDKLEHGFDQGNNNLAAISGMLRKLLDDKRDQIKALGTGKLEHFNKNYAPHYYDQGEKKVSQAAQKAAKRPMEGSKSFLKKRTFETLKEAIDAGLTPLSYNPVDLVLLKIREMDKYLMAHRTIKEYKANGLAKYVKIGEDVPEGWQKIDDRISTVFKSPMVAVKEAYDAKMMEDMSAVGKSLGIDLERSPRMEGEGKRYGDVWGLSMSDASKPGEPGKIFTRFAGPESALAHELGHQLDHIYGLQSKFLSDPKINNELSDLANQRISEVAKSRKASKKDYEGLGLAKSADAFKEYVQKPEEKMAAMLEAYIHAPELLKEVAPATYGKLTDFLNSNAKLKPLTEVKPSLVMGTNESEVYAGGAVIAGHIYAQPDAARIINNYLSPGLQKSAIFQAYRYAGNLINQFQLGFSAFHLGFTSLDSSISKFALALGQLADGHPVKAVTNALKVPFAPVENVIRGDALLKAWRGQGKSPADDVLAQSMASAGGRANMDQFYATRAYDQMKHHFEAGNIGRGILHIPLSLVEASSKPILEYIVPRQKLGVFADIMKMEMENNPGMSHTEMREMAQKAWDSVDNRMGQLVYDNLFWNRTFKDLLMGSVRSVGWNLGTIREILGGTQDYGEAINDALHGDKPEFTYRMGYVAALPILVGMIGAIIQYLRTGQGPQEMKDYFFPKTGGVDARGDAHRIALPSYMKDLYHWEQNPAKTAIDKLQPILSIMADMLQNKDYYGVKIRNEDDPLVRQVASEVVFSLKQIQPFSVRNMQKNLETENKSLFDTVGPWVGITPAPYDIDQTKAEKAAHEIVASHQQIGGRTEEQAERSKLLGDLARQYRRGDPAAMDNLFKAYQAGAISHRQMQNVIANARLTPLQRMVKGMTLEETERVYSKANDEEKAQIERYLQKKTTNQAREFVMP